MGYPIGDGLRVDEGVPIFSAFTGIPVPNPSGCFEIPGIFPASSNSFDGACYGVRGAGGSL